MKTFTFFRQTIFLSILSFSFSGLIAQQAPGTATGPFKPSTTACTPSATTNCPQITNANFNDSKHIPGTGNNGNNVGAIWRYYNVFTDNSNPLQPVPVNVIITIDAAYQAQVLDFDNPNAKDQNNNFLPNLFAPTIASDQKLTVDRNGYVQFTFTFYKDGGATGSSRFDDINFTNLQPLANLNYVHYDIDGLVETDINGLNPSNKFELRETGVVQQIAATNPQISVNANSELNPYNYNGDGKDWRGYVGSAGRRLNTSNCAEVVAAFQYTSTTSSVTVRLGYNFDLLQGSIQPNDVGAPGRLYATTFGCYNFPAESPLPIKMKSFSAARNQSNVDLKWVTSAEQNNTGFAVQRLIGSGSWQQVAFVPSKAAAGNSNADLFYSYTDLNNTNGISQYRLLQVDMSSKIQYSDIRSVQGMKQAGKLIIAPNPSSTGSVNVLFENSTDSRAIILVDNTGRKLRQWNNVTDNSLQITNLSPGVYNLKIMNVSKGEMTNKKIIVNQ